MAQARSRAELRSMAVAAAVVSAAALLAACGGSSSGVGTNTPSPSSDASTTQEQVDVVINATDQAMRNTFLFKNQSSVRAQFHSMLLASQDLMQAGTGLVPAPAGVPKTIADEAQGRMYAAARLLQRIADCLSAQGQRPKPDYPSCYATVGHKIRTDIRRLGQAIGQLGRYGSPAQQTAALRFWRIIDRGIPK